jgi:hypothetical protein
MTHSPTAANPIHIAKNPTTADGDADISKL